MIEIETNTKHIVWHSGNITHEDRHLLNGHVSGVLWLTGLSGAGKSSLACAVEKKLYAMNIRSYVLDGDNLRHGLNNNLGFSPEDRQENIRRVGEVAKLFVDAGLFAISAFISPYRSDRQLVRNLFTEEKFVEVYVECSLETCEQRDPKGLYKKARQGEIKEFTGISAPYEPPLDPELIINTQRYTIDESADFIVKYLKQTKRLQ